MVFTEYRAQATRVSPIGIAISCILLLTSAATAWGANSASVAVSAVVLSKSNCRFTTAAVTLNFGALNPTTPVDVTTTATASFRCNGSTPTATYFITSDDGLYPSGPGSLRMRHSTNPALYLPYALSSTPTTDTVPKGVPQTLSITGTVRGVDYQTATPGTYSDTVTLSIIP